MIVVAGTATIHSEHWDEAVKQTQQMSAATEAETGCISYRIYVQPTQHDTFFIFEEWKDAEALAHHFQTPHFQAFGAYLASVINGNLDIKRYDVSSVGPLY